MTFAGRLTDSDVYVDAAEAGLGVFDMPVEKSGVEQREFLPVAQWVQGDASIESYAPTSNVVPLFGRR